MKKLLYTSLVLALFISGTAMAQKKAVIKFDKIEHDFGTIKEEGGKVKIRFNFKNDGNDTLKIISVLPSCGCIKSEWTKTPILPKKAGYIDAEYDPNARPGIFSKGIAVVTNDPAQTNLNLTIKGDVVPKPKSYADAFPVVTGNLRFETTQFNFGNAKNSEIRCDTLKMYNGWRSAMTIGFKDIPSYVTVKAIPENIKPGKDGMIIINYDVSKRNDFGYVYDRVILTTNDSLQPDKTLNISLNIVEDFSKLTDEQLANAPKIKFDKTTYNFHTIKLGDKVDCIYNFTNEGKSDLIIRKVKASCGCTATNPEKTVLKPGESSKIRATFNSAGREGKQYKTVSVICNDPTSANVMLTLEGTVEKPATTTDQPAPVQSH